MAFLSQHAGRVMTYAAIVRAIWGDTDCGSTNKLQVNMANLRKNQGSVPGRNTYILNELGVGYRMIDEDIRSGSDQRGQVRPSRVRQGGAGGTHPAP